MLPDRGTAPGNRSGAATVPGPGASTEAGRRAGDPGNHRADREARALPGHQESALSG